MAEFGIDLNIDKHSFDNLENLKKALEKVSIKAMGAELTIEKMSKSVGKVSDGELKKASDACTKFGVQLKYAAKEQDIMVKKASLVSRFRKFLDAAKNVNKVSTSAKGVQTAFSATKKSSEKCFKTVNSGSKSSGKFLSSIGAKIKSIAGNISVFSLLKKGFNVMVQEMKKGFENLAQYSGDYNNTISSLKGQVSQMGNSLAAAFEPIANAVIPYITQLVSWITTAADAMGQFLAAVQGKSTYTKAKKQMVDYAKSLDTASEAAKRTVAAFDELNVISENTTGSAGTTDSSNFETALVSSEAANKALDFALVLASFENLKNACEPFLGEIYEGLKWFIDEILTPLGSWVVSEAVPTFLNLLSVALTILTIIIKELKPYGKWLWDELLKPIAEWTGEKIIEGIMALTEKLSDFSDWCSSDSENVDLMSSIILGFLSGIVTYYSVKKITAMLAGITQFFKDFILAVSAGISPMLLAALAVGTLAAGIIYLSSNWDKLSGAQRVITILGALAAAAIAAAVAIAIFHTSWSVGVAAAAIVGGLALLGLTSACLKYNGDTSEDVATSFYGGNDFSGSPLPELADGAVIQGGKPFAAILGDQKFGQTNVETPLQTMIDAFKIAMADSGASTGGNYTFVAQLDGRTIFQETVKQNDMYQRSTGHSAFVF